MSVGVDGGSVSVVSCGSVPESSSLHIPKVGWGIIPSGHCGGTSTPAGLGAQSLSSPSFGPSQSLSNSSPQFVSVCVFVES